MAGGINPFGFAVSAPQPAPRAPIDLPSAPFGFAPPPSKWEQTAAILNEYNPIDAFWRLYNSDMAKGGAITDQNIADGFGVASTVMGGSSFAGRPANSLGMGGKPKSELTVWSDLAKTKHPIPVEEMRAVVTPTGTLLPRTIVDPQSLQGSILVPAVGDRTAAGGVLRQVNDTPLANAVGLEGGPDFMRSQAQAQDNAIWASDKGVISRLVGHAQNLAETGKPVNKVYSAMGARSGDFSTMMSDALLNQIPNSKITKKTVKEFDSEMKSMIPDWPGLMSGSVREFLAKSGNARKDFAETVALGKYQEKGFPEIGSTRFAISEPALIGQPTGVSGYAISRVDPEKGIIQNPSVPHTTYNTQMAGQYLGGLENHIPREVMFPSFYKTRRAQGSPTGADDRAFSMSNVSQNADQEWLDGLMGYLSGIKPR